MPQQQAAIALSPKIRRRQGRTRQRILDESARLFIAKGFENVSVEEIIAAAEIARSSFYRFFSNREEVLANIIRPVFEQGIVELDASTPHSGNHPEWQQSWPPEPPPLAQAGHLRDTRRCPLTFSLPGPPTLLWDDWIYKSQSGRKDQRFEDVRCKFGRNDAYSLVLHRF